MSPTSFKYLLLLVLVFTSKVHFAQYLDFQKYKYEWKSAPQELELADAFSDFDAVLLDEKTTFKFLQLKSDFIKGYVERKGVIHFKNEKGIAAASKFILPESLDPPSDQGALFSLKNHVAKWMDVEIVFFAARVIHEDGTTEKAETSFKQSLRKDRLLEKNFDQFIYSFSIDNLVAGDRLEFHYKIEIPYRVNWYHFTSTRFFFHAKLPKQQSSFELVLHKNHRAEIEGPETDKIWEQKKYIHRLYSFSSLAPAMAEVTSRPYIELPHLKCRFNVDNEYFLYRHPLSNDLIQREHWLVMLRLSLKNAVNHMRFAKRKHVIDKGSKKYRDFILGYLKQADKKEPILALRSIHQDINENFRYHSDQAYYDEKDLGLEKLGDNIDAKIIRDISRNNVYNRTLTLLRIPYDVAVISDNRIGDYGKHYTGKLKQPDYLYLVDSPTGDHYYPRRDGKFYAHNEIPFYWSDSPMLIFKMDSIWMDPYIKQKWVKMKTITDGVNQRMANIKVEADLKLKSLKFDVHLDLQGQWSTLTRGIYQGDPIDSTVNPAYSQKLYNLPRTVNLFSEDVVSQQYEPLALTKIELLYSSEEIIQVENEVYTIPLRDFFNFITWPIDFEHRSLDFYFDYQFRDELLYEFDVGDDVELLNIDDLNFSIENELGTFAVSTKVKDEATIQVSASWVNKSDVAVLEELNQLQEIYNGIEQLDRSVLKLKTGSSN